VSSLVAALLLQAAVTAAAPAPVARALRVDEPISVDGLLEEPAWSSAPPVSGFRQRDPDEGAPATEGTVVRVLYDRDTLYVGVLALDREPAKVVARILQRDELMQQQGDNSFKFAGDDAVALVLDTFGDKRNAFLFATNPKGAKFDALVTDESPALNVEWRGVWRVAARRTPEGWSAEFAIPFRTLRYPKLPADQRAWGFNVERMLGRRNEDSLWAAWSRATGGLYRVSQAGRLEGLAGLPRSSFNAELKPYALGGVTQPQSPSGAALGGQAQWSAGADAKWEIQPGVVLDATAKPDFAEVEADDDVVNLTRFELYRPEKREFFLENAGLFEFGTRGSFETPPFLMFFSRRIGIAGDAEVPVLGGVRLSGRLGRQTLGLLDVLTADSPAQPRTNFGVLRFKRDVGERSYVGAMLTDRRSSEATETDLGVDASVWATSTLQLEGFAARTSRSGAPADSAYRLAAQYQGFPVFLSGQHLEIGAGATTGVGFVTRAGIKRTDVKAQYTFLPRVLGLRSFTLYAGGQYLTRVDGAPQERNWFPGFAVTWDSGESLSVTHVRGRSVLDLGFELAERVPVAAGRYAMRDTEISASTSGKRSLSATAQVSLFDDWGGRLETLSAGAQWRLGACWALSLNESRSAARMPAGSFAAYLSALRLRWTPSTRVSVATYLQYNSLTRRLTANFRADLVHHPGSDLYVVFNEERGSEAAPWSLVDRGFALKLDYLIRF
jgi:Domain of unknown function (DUF5916)